MTELDKAICARISKLSAWKKYSSNPALPECVALQVGFPEQMGFMSLG
jgi:hypothetical protein